MKTRTRRPIEEQEQDASAFLFEEEEEDLLDLEDLTEEELEAMLFEEEDTSSKSPFNLPTIAGLSMILVGVGYIFQQLGLWNGLDFSLLAGMLPWLAGILIILLGFGVLSWSPERKKQRARMRAEAAARKSRSRRSAKTRASAASASKRSTASTSRAKVKATQVKRRLQKSRNKKISGVCAGLAEYFGIDPTLVRIAFVIGTIASGGPFILAYIILAIIMPNPDKPPKLTPEERIKIIRDS
ncbi:PspC domain-containing protein [Rhodocaloribacter sp.]